MESLEALSRWYVLIDWGAVLYHAHRTGVGWDPALRFPPRISMSSVCDWPTFYCLVERPRMFGSRSVAPCQHVENAINPMKLAFFIRRPNSYHGSRACADPQWEGGMLGCCFFRAPQPGDQIHDVLDASWRVRCSFIHQTFHAVLSTFSIMFSLIMRLHLHVLQLSLCEVINVNLHNDLSRRSSESKYVRIARHRTSICLN